MTAPLDRFGQTLEYFGFCPCHNQLLSAGDKGGTPTSGESLSLEIFFFAINTEGVEATGVIEMKKFDDRAR
jgi:hypothetical protein